MPNINVAIIGGHLGRDPEQEGTGPARFSVAVTDRWKDENGEKQERTNWVHVVAWNGNAKVAMDRLKKGDPVIVEGSFRSSEWDDKESGQKRSKIEIVASSIHLITRNGSKKKDT